jgi:hypothetical protein
MNVKSGIAIHDMALYLPPALKRRTRNGLLSRIEHPNGGKLRNGKFGSSRNPSNNIFLTFQGIEWSENSPCSYQGSSRTSGI